METSKLEQAAENTFSHVKQDDTEFVSDGLCDFFLYRDLGIAKATGGKVIAQLMRANKPPEWMRSSSSRVSPVRASTTTAAFSFRMKSTDHHAAGGVRPVHTQFRLPDRIRGTKNADRVITTCTCSPGRMGVTRYGVTQPLAAGPAVYGRNW